MRDKIEKMKEHFFKQYNIELTDQAIRDFLIYTFVDKVYYGAKMYKTFIRANVRQIEEARDIIAEIEKPKKKATRKKKEE